MLSPATLERVSASYRRGYYDGYDGKPLADEKAPTHPFDRPFAVHDYANGHKAGANDRAWNDFYAGRGPNPKSVNQPTTV